MTVADAPAPPELQEAPEVAPPELPDTEPQPPAAFSAEALMAVTGIKRVLEREPQKITAADKHAAAALPREMRRAVSRFLDPDTVPRQVPKMKRFDYAKALDQITKALEPQHLADLAGMFRPSDAILGAEYLALATRLLGYLQSILPIRTLKTMATTINVDPSDAEIARFRRAYDVVNDPMIVLRDMEYLMLVGDQVNTVATNYPTLYAMMRDRMALGMADELAKKKHWELPRRKDFQVQVLFQTNMTSPGLFKTLQESFEKMEKEKTEGGVDGTAAPAEKLARIATTATQRIEEGIK